jgi:hypothetical protein
MLLIDIQQNPNVGPKNGSHKEVLSKANFRARMFEVWKKLPNAL